MQGKVVYELGVEANEGNNDIEIPSQQLPMGIAQITIFDANEIPQTERLVFLNKNRQLNIQIKTDRQNYQILDSVWVDLWVTDETGKGVAGDFSMAVVDDKVFTFADDKQDNILSYLLLSSDLKGKVYEPSFYFDPQEEKADQALDLVMLTHGWRRYEWSALLAKQAKKQWQKQRKFEPEPQTALAGQLQVNGEPYANAKIRIKSPTGIADSCYQGSKSLKTDQEGYFYLPNYKATCNLRLEANYRGVMYHTYYNPPRPKAKLRTGALFQRKRFVPNRPSIAKNKPSTTYSTTPSAGKGAIKGEIIDAGTGEIIPFATVTLSQNNVIKHGVASDLDGLYRLNNIEAGNYTLNVKYLGYEEVELTINIHAN